MSTIEIKHGDAVVTVHRRTPRSDLKRMSWLRRAREWLQSAHKEYGVTPDDLQLSVWAWLNAASRVTVDGDIPIPLPNGHDDGAEMKRMYDAYMDMEDPTGMALADKIADAMNKLDQPFDEALAPVPPDDPEKKASGKRGK